MIVVSKQPHAELDQMTDSGIRIPLYNFEALVLN